MLSHVVLTVHFVHENEMVLRVAHRRWGREHETWVPHHPGKFTREAKVFVHSVRNIEAPWQTPCSNPSACHKCVGIPLCWRGTAVQGCQCLGTTDVVRNGSAIIPVLWIASGPHVELLIHCQIMRHRISDVFLTDRVMPRTSKSCRSPSMYECHSTLSSLSKLHVSCHTAFPQS